MKIDLTRGLTPGAVEITKQKRNVNQSAGEIEFTFHPFRPKIAESGARS